MTVKRYNAIYVVHKTKPEKFKSFTNILNAHTYLDSKNRKAGYPAYELVAVEAA
jgi:hypothetical protein